MVSSCEVEAESAVVSKWMMAEEVVGAMEGRVSAVGGTPEDVGILMIQTN